MTADLQDTSIEERALRREIIVWYQGEDPQGALAPDREGIVTVA